MDLDQLLMRLQGALSSFAVTTPDNQKLQLLSALFQNVDETAKTKMVLFMILNTKMSITNLLLNDGDVHIVTQNTQNLDFSAFSYVIFHLNLVGNLSEIVSNIPAPLTVEFLAGVFAYADSRIQIRGLHKVIVGIFQKILKITKGVHREFSYVPKLWEFMNMFADMLWATSSFDNEELLEDDMSNILETCLSCVNLFQERTPLSFNETYELRILRDKLQIDELGEVPPPDCKTRMVKYVYKLLDLFNDISNSWYKYDPIDNLTAASEIALSLYERLQGSSIEPSNLYYLDEIKMRPQAELEIMANSDVNTIIDRILISPAPEKWLKALINCPKVTETKEAIICLKNNLDSLDPQDLKAVAVKLQAEFLQNSVSDISRDLYFSCLSKLSLVELLLHFDSYFALEQRPNLENSTFDEELTKFFNKMLARDGSTKSNLVIFCIQSPVKTIKKICERAIYNAEQLHYCSLDLNMLKSACLAMDVSSEEEPELDIITSVLRCMINKEDYGPAEKARLITLIQRVQDKEVLDINMETFLLNMIREELSLANYDKIEFALEILKANITTNSVRSNKIVLLAFFSQLLSQTSWSCSTYSAKLAQVRDILISNIYMTLHNGNYSNNVTGLTWLRNEIMKTGEINRVHFCELWYAHNNKLAISSDLYIQLFTLIHTRTKTNSIIDLIVKTFRPRKLLNLRISFTAAFIQILPILTYRGWASLMINVKTIIISWLDFQKEKSDIDVDLVLFRIFSMSLYSLAQDMNQNKDMIPCFSHCLRNFGRMIQENFLEDKDLKYEVAVVFVEEILFLLNGIQDPELRKEFSVSLSPVLFGIESLAKKSASGEGSKLADLENWYQKNFIGQVGTEPLSID